MMTQAILAAGSADPRMQGDPNTDRYMGAMLAIGLGLFFAVMLAMLIFDRLRDRSRRSGPGAVLVREFRQPQDDELTQMMREW